jgi:hypothetical protein
VIKNDEKNLRLVYCIGNHKSCDLLHRENVVGSIFDISASSHLQSGAYSEMCRNSVAGRGDFFCDQGDLMSS